MAPKAPLAPARRPGLGNSLGSAAFKRDDYFTQIDFGDNGLWCVVDIVRKGTKSGAAVIFRAACITPGHGAQTKPGDIRQIFALETSGGYTLQDFAKFLANAARIPRDNALANDAIARAYDITGLPKPRTLPDGGFDLANEAEEKMALSARSNAVEDLYVWALEGEGTRLAASSHKDGLGLLRLNVRASKDKDGNVRVSAKTGEPYANFWSDAADFDNPEGSEDVTRVAEAVRSGALSEKFVKAFLNAEFVQACLDATAPEATVAA